MTPHPETALAAYALLTLSGRRSSGEPDYLLARIVRELAAANIPTHVVGGELLFGDGEIRYVIDNYDEQGRPLMPIVDLAPLLYAYCFGERYELEPTVYMQGRGDVMTGHLNKFANRLAAPRKKVTDADLAELQRHRKRIHESWKRPVLDPPMTERSPEHNDRADAP